MNKTFLDALLIDQALGALSSETEALLEAYLEKAPEQAAEMDHIRSAIDLAREAFHEEDPTTLPAFRAPARLRRRRLRKYSLQAAAMAAALAAGFLFGQSRVNPAPLSAPATLRAGLESETVPGTTGIWSITPDRLRSKPEKPSGWKWHSPIQQPRLVTQEMNHET
jgi:anti-sigma factor RsiW